MNIQHSYISLEELGNLTTYDFSGEKGELVHEFAPLIDYSDYVAIFVAEGADLREALTLDNGTGRPISESLDYKSGNYQDTKFSVLAVPMSQDGMLAKFRFFGNPDVALHVAVIKSTAHSIRQLFETAKGKILQPIFLKFKDHCWVCKKVIRFLCSAILGGVIDIDTDDIEDILKDILPDEWLDHLNDSDIGDMIKIIRDLIRRNDPRNLIAQNVCTRLGYCKTEPNKESSIINEEENKRLLHAFQYLKSRGIIDPDIDFWIAMLNNILNKLDDINDLSIALESGANPNISISELLRRYEEELREMSK